MNHDIEVRIHEHSGSSKIVIKRVFDSALTPDEAADQVRELWKDYVMPIQQGLTDIYAPMRRALEASAAQEHAETKSEE